MTNIPLKQQQLQFICFVDKQNESLEIISPFSLPCWLREQRLRKFNSKDFMSHERKIAQEITKYSVNRGKQPYANEMKRKRQNLGTEACLSASDENGDKGGITCLLH